MSLQSDLLAFIARCNPGEPPAADAYVERPSPITSRLLLEVRPSERSRVLLLGQTGVGKSTELARVAEASDPEFCVIAAPIDRFLDLGQFSWHDIVVFTATWALESRGFTESSAYKRLSAALRPVERLSIEVTGGVAGVIDDAAKEALLRTSKIGGPPPPTVTQRFRNNTVEVHETIDSGKAQFWDLAVAAIRFLEQETGHPALMLVDGLEKMPDDAARSLFYDGRRYLEEWPCRAVVTAPLSLSFETFFGEVEEQFLHTERLRAISSLEGEPGFKFFVRLAEARGGDHLFEPGLLEGMVSWGGGLPRQFVQLAVYAATRALEEEQPLILPEHFARARQRATDRWQYQLGPEEFKALARMEEDRTLAERARLLRLGALVEYDKPDGSLRLGVNPLVGALLKGRSEAGDE